MNIFIFTTELNEWNSIIIKEILNSKIITVKGIYTSKSLGGDKGLKQKIKRLLNYGVFNLFLIFFQKIKNKKKNESIAECSKLLLEKATPIFSGKKMSIYLDKAIEQKSDLIVLLYFNRIIPKRYIRDDVRMINIHPGKLPFYRGAQPVFWSMLNEEKELGISIHKVEKGIDTGDIFVEQTIEIKSKSLYQNMINVSEYISKILPEAIERILKKEIVPKKQKESTIYYTRPNSNKVREFLKKGNKYY